MARASLVEGESNVPHTNTPTRKGGRDERAMPRGGGGEGGGYTHQREGGQPTPGRCCRDWALPCRPTYDCMCDASEGGSCGEVAAAGMPLGGDCVAATQGTVGWVCAMGIWLSEASRTGGGTAFMGGATTASIVATSLTPLLPATVWAAWQMGHLRKGAPAFPAS